MPDRLVVSRARGKVAARTVMLFTALGCAMLASSLAHGQGARSPSESWGELGGDPQGTFYSPLADINDRNVQRLGFAWEYRTGTGRGLEATPLVVDGVMYTSGNWGVVYALNAQTGKLLWN